MGAITNLTLTRMTIQQNTGESGLLICAASAVAISITDSEFLGNNVGVSARGGVAAATSIQNSRFVGNVAGLIVEGDGGALNATNNWWGCGDGPGTTGCDRHQDDAGTASITSTPFNSVDTIRVTNLNNSGDGSLRRAVDEANLRPGPDTIRFAVSGTIALTGAGMNLTNEGTTIDATGRSVIIDGAAMDTPNNIFQVGAGSAGFIGFTIRKSPANALSFDSGSCGGTVNITIGAMTFRENSESGINICSSTAAGSVTGSRFENNGNGIGLSSTTGDNSGLTVGGNQFLGNGVGIRNQGSGMVNAENNWWGCNDGPGNTGCDSVSANVDSDPSTSDFVVVTTNADSGDGSLRQAISDAAPGSTIVFQSDVSITLLQGLSINKAGLTIDSNGYAVILNAAFLPPFADAIQATTGFTLIGVEIVNPPGDGVGIHTPNQCVDPLDSLVLENVTITGAGLRGVLICAAGIGSVSITGSTIEGTQAGLQACRCGNGGDPGQYSLGNLNIENSSISGREGGVVFNGGAIDVTVLGVRIAGSTITGQGLGVPGQSWTSGLAFPGATIDVNGFTVENSVVSGNPAIDVSSLGNINGTGFSLTTSTITGGVRMVGSGQASSLSGIAITGNHITGAPAGSAVELSAGSLSSITISDNPSLTATGGSAVSLTRFNAPIGLSAIKIERNGLIRGSSHGMLIGGVAAVVSDFRISDNGSIQGVGSGSSGIAFFGGDSLTASDIALERNGSIAGGTLGAGVFIGSFDGASTIDGVSISNNSSIVGGSAGITIGNQGATGINTALNINGNGEIRGNDAGGVGLILRGRNPGIANLITANAISGAAYGVRIRNQVADSPSRVTLVANRMTNSSGAGVEIQAGAATGVVLNLNSITGNGVGLANADVAMVEAYSNWWGCIGGPGSAGCDTVTGNVAFDPWLQIGTNTVRTSEVVSENRSVGASALPDGSLVLSGASATVQSNASSGGTSITVSTYPSNPSTSVFDAGGEFVDIFVSDPGAVRQVIASFYYPASVTGQPEQDLVLMYFDNEQWRPVRSSGNVDPVKDTTDNLDGSVSGGRFTVVLDNSSSPTPNQLSGTMITMNANGAPVLGTVNGPTAPIQEGTLTSVSASFSDVGPVEGHMATIDWGDDSTTTATLGVGVTSLSESHTYRSAGVYTVTVTVKDSLGQSGSTTLQYIVVYDPSAGFVTGGGWFNSPLGAYAPDPLLAGKATFGFVSRYNKGANTPTGNTEFQFKAGNLNFSSTSYEWLVVAGSKAQFRGRGTINGQGDYAFFVTAIDGDSDGGKKPDKFRIRIWDRLNGGLVYDNQLNAPDDAEPTTVLGGGSIVIHK
ncbi:MAG: hypothetical protein IH609_15865 [Dehalococcoidia bacterium]|nr:hypothetical protein [Dehalococcoidia bacterium]